MSRLFFALAIVSTLLISAENSGPFKASARSSKVTIDAELYLDKGQVEQLIGNSMDGYLVVVKVKISSNRPAEAIRIFRDDFVLVSEKDGQRSEPFSPDMLAGSSTMVVSEEITSAGPVMGQNTGPVWGGGIPTGGPVPTGSPRRIDNPNSPGGSFGSGTATTTAVKQEVRNDKAVADKAGEKAWIDVLNAKVMKDGEMGEPIEGLLYFPLDGKHKPKHLSLLFNGTLPKLVMEFDEK